MRVLILAAGKGTRISRYLSGKPKCTVNIGEEKLIHYTVRTLKNIGIKDIGIIVGYNQEEVKKALKDYKVNYYYNPFYDVTNSIGSAWFAKEFFDNEEEDIMIMNGDVFMEENLIKDILEEDKMPVMFSDERRKEEGDYKFYYEDNILMKYGKELKGKDITGEYIGVAKISKEMLGAFKTRLNRMIEEQEHSLWWENILYSMTDERDIYVKNVGERFWGEVDYIEDYDRILNFRSYKIEFNIDVKKVELEGCNI